MTRPSPRRAAFTLVEMLVVIFIIAALAAMLLVGINAAIKASHNYAMKMEVSQLAQAVEAYKQNKGDYPPSFKEDYSLGNRTNTVAWRHVTRCYPKMTPTKKKEFFDLLLANPGLTGAEGLVFWLSRTGSDLQAPFGDVTSSPYVPPTDAKVYFPFDERRLISTVGPFAGYKGKYAKDTVYAYFDSRTYNLEKGAVGAKPYYKVTNMGTVSSEAINATTFQIICAGLDGQFGDGVTNQHKGFPIGVTGLPVNCSEGDSDNITNFGDGKLLKDLLD